MKNLKLILAIIVICLNTGAHAQSFKKGTNVISAGIGIGSSIGSSYTNSSQTPGISLQFEHGMWEVGGPGVISLGGYVGIKSYKNDYAYTGYHYPQGYYNYDVTQKWNYTVIGIRSAYHYSGLNNDKLDVYGGVMLSYDILSYSYTANDPYNDNIYHDLGSYGSTTAFSIYVGGRYYFSDKVGAYLELGYGVAYVNIGVALKL